MCRVIRIFVFCESGTSVSAAHKAKMAAEPAPGGLAIGRVVCGGLRKKWLSSSSHGRTMVISSIANNLDGAQFETFIMRSPIWNFHHAERAWPAEGSERHRRMIACCCCWAWHVLVPGTSGAPQPAGLLFDITPTGPNPALPYPSLLLPCYTLLGSQLTFYDLFYTHLQYMNILNNMEAASLDKDQSIVGTSGMSLLRTPATL